MRKVMTAITVCVLLGAVAVRGRAMPQAPLHALLDAFLSLHRNLDKTSAITSYYVGEGQGAEPEGSRPVGVG